MLAVYVGTAEEEAGALYRQQHVLTGKFSVFKTAITLPSLDQYRSFFAFLLSRLRVIMPTNIKAIG